MYAFAFGFGFGRSGGGTLADIFVTPPAAIASASAVAPTVEVTGAPLAPINVTLIASLSDRGASSSDGISNDPTPNYQMDFDEVLAEGDTIHQFLDDVLHDSYVIQAADLISGLPPGCFDPLPGDDTYAITFKHQNPGGTSPASSPSSYTLNTSLGATTLALAAGGLITADTTPTVRVANASAVEDDEAEVRRVDDGTVLGTKTWDATDASNGYADITLSALSVAEHALMGYVYGTAGGSGAGTLSEEGLATLEITAALAISGTPVLTATEDSAYDGFTASATGGVEPYVFSLEGTWPAGISIDSGTGVVSGTPTESGSFADLFVRVTDAESNTDDLATFTLEVASAAYTAQGVNFDGATVLPRGGGLTGAADSKVGLFVGWVMMQGGNGAENRIIDISVSGALRFGIRRDAAHKFNVFARNAAGTTILNCPGLTSYTDTMTDYICLMMAWNLAIGVVQIYVGDTADTGTPATLTDDTIDYTNNEAAIGGRQTDATARLNADVADVRLWIDQTLDLSVEANRRKFIDAAGKPVNPALSGLTAAIIDQQGATATWHTNQGSGGGFTETGTLTDAATSPSD